MPKIQIPKFSGFPNPENPNPEIQDSRPIFKINTKNPEKKIWNFFDNFFGFFTKKSVKVSIFRNGHTENVRESRKCLGIPKMFGNPENSVLLNRKTKKNRKFFLKILKKIKNKKIWEIFQDLSVVRESRKFSNPEREYQIPENPIPGLFGNTEFPKMFYSRTSGFPKQKNSGMAPPYYRHTKAKFLIFCGPECKSKAQKKFGMCI